MIDEMDKLLRNRIFVDRSKDIGVISKEDAIAFGISGPNLRGAGSITTAQASVSRL